MTGGLAPITFPAYETLRSVTELSAVILCDNPSEMTFEGTNTVILRAPGSPTCVVVDPGPDDRVHAERIAALVGEIELVVVTHRHGDHTDGIGHLRSFTSAPVRAVQEEFCRDAAPLVDGEELHAAGLDIIVLATPGHTADSISLFLPESKLLFCGDAAMNAPISAARHAIWIEDQADYGRSWDKMLALRPARVYPSHGLPFHPRDLARYRHFLDNRPLIPPNKSR